ncbi:MAG: ferrochelatase [Saprospiraceae bacterium]|nr:ferrochelatase [Saprospiraceae bacterium]
MGETKPLSGIHTKTGVLIVNLGTPDEPTRGAVYRYLKEFLLDPRVIDINAVARNLLVRGIIAPFRSGKSAKAYQELWTPNGSPLKIYGERLVSQVQALLGENYAVELAMRYQNPSIASSIDKLMAQKVSNIVVFTLFPQYASATIGSVHEEVMRVLSRKQIIPSVEFISSYCEWEDMVKIYADNARQFDLNSYDHILFSYHGVPQRHLRKGDDFNHCLKNADCCQTLTPTNQYCYSAQCYATTRAIAGELELDKSRFTVCFQSRLGADPWTQPYTVRTIEELAKKGVKRLLVFCPAFTADCLETTIEIGSEYKEDFEKWGGEHLDLVPSLNDNPAWASAVAKLIRG